jgi:hypothetical protein
MTSPLIVGRWKLDRRISTGDDYDTCQAWAHSLRLAGFTGIYYEPRHDPRGHLADASSIALFSDPGHQPQMMTYDRDGQISPWVIADAQKHFGLLVLPRVTLPQPGPKHRPSNGADHGAET